MTSGIVLVSGASGLIGSALVPALREAGYGVRTLVRHPPRGDHERAWDPAAQTLDPTALDDCVAVVHLAGENIGQRWSEMTRRRILTSRVQGTGLLASAIAAHAAPPSVFVSGSAVGFYGDRGDEALTEASASGGGFLADVCRQWESAALVARERTRVVTIRTGVVLSRRGGALARMIPPFKLGVGGRLGDGRQWMSWIALVDHVRAIVHSIRTPSLSGGVNLTAPHPITNAELTRALARALHRPAVFPVPKAALRLVFGEMADETLLVSQRVVPAALAASGFQFTAPTIEEGLRLSL